MRRKRFYVFAIYVVVLLIFICCDKTTAPQSQVKDPELSPPGGTFFTPIEVEITCSTKDSVIRYSLDGSEPDMDSEIYHSPILITESVTLRAKGFLEGWITSDTVIGVYVMSPADLSQGDGTADNPYRIGSLDDLFILVNNPDLWNSHFIQTADIDVAETLLWYGGKGWKAVGTFVSHNSPDNQPFSGHYDGNNFVIDRLYLNRPEDSHQGLFGFVSDAVIENIGVTNIEVTAFNAVGGLVGKQLESTIRNCFSSGTVQGEEVVGGLVGFNLSSDESSMILNSFSTANVIGIQSVGGLAGMHSGTIGNCYSRGVITGESYAIGGLVGFLEMAAVTNSYTTSTFSGAGGGLIGFASYICYVGNSYYQLEISAQSASYYGEPRTTEEMTYPYADNTYIDWNFETIWVEDIDYHNDGYPYLKWQKMR